MQIPAAFKNLGHMIASNAQKFVAFVATDVDKFVGVANADKSIVLSFAAVAGPQATAITNAGYAALGIIGQLLDSGAKDVEDLLTKAAPADVLNDIKSTIALVKQVPKSA